jgi:hypothetical protein
MFVLIRKNPLWKKDIFLLKGEFGSRKIIGDPKTFKKVSSGAKIIIEKGE